MADRRLVRALEDALSEGCSDLELFRDLLSPPRLPPETFIETEAYNAIEDYRLQPDGTIQTIFTFNKGSFDGPRKEYRPRGFVIDPVHKSEWRMQFVWPLKSEFLITHLSPDYSRTVIGRNKRDYVWIMARPPTIAESDYTALVDELKGQGYDITRLRRVPQQAATSR